MIARLVCWFKGHLRGRLEREEGKHRVFRCPRCKRETRYRTRKA